MPIDPNGNWYPGPSQPTPMLPMQPQSSAPGAITYAGPPTLTPPNIQYIVGDTNDNIWLYSNGKWNLIV